MRKYCCDDLERIMEDIVYDSVIKRQDFDHVMMIRPEFECSACDWISISYCPFCGSKLGGKK